MDRAKGRHGKKNAGILFALHAFKTLHYFKVFRYFLGVF
jgi:hypothetical protein